MYTRVVPWRRPRRRDEALATIRDGTSNRSLVVIGAVLAGAAVVAIAGRRWLWQALGMAAKAVEEVADTVEDAAEDMGELAAERSDAGSN